MLAFRTILTALLTLLFVSHYASAQVVLKDDDVTLDKSELEYMVSQWPNQMRRSAADDEGDRLELLNRVIIIKKMAREADKIQPGTEAYWRLSTQITGLKRKFVLEEFSDNLEMPDFSKLAAERYETEKEKYARVPEVRKSSHILFSCPPGECSRPDTKIAAQKVLDELRAGADFTAMVEAHSGDPGSKTKGGKFDRWIKSGDTGVAGPYSEGLFKIEKVGDYSDLVSTKFGVHIIRFDDVQEEHFLPYEDVKAQIIADLETEYRRLSITEFSQQFNMSDDIQIDGDAMEEIFAPYKSSK
jgi:hypothetical protein